MTNAEFAEEVNASVNIFGGGSLRIWGHWYGRPRDCIRGIVSASPAFDNVVLNFDGDERLLVWDPAGLEITPDVFRIKAAHRVRFEWCHRGHFPSPTQLYYEDYTNYGRRIIATTNDDSYEHTLSPTPRMPAVELI